MSLLGPTEVVARERELFVFCAPLLSMAPIAPTSTTALCVCLSPASGGVAGSRGRKARQGKGKGRNYVVRALAHAFVL